MTGPEHYREAESLLDLAAQPGVIIEHQQVFIAAAQAHATLSLAAAAAHALPSHEWSTTLLPGSAEDEQ